MTYFVYLIGNYKPGKLVTYVGYSNNVKRRISLHNRGKGAKFTKGRKWKLIYCERFNLKKEAILREIYLKKNRKLRKQIIEKYK